MASLIFQLNRSFPKVNLKGKEPSSNTILQYKNDSFRFARWAEDELNCTKMRHLKKHIQDYVDKLIAEGKAPSTIYKYAVACCHLCRTSVSDLELPKRHTWENTRSRGLKKSDKRTDTKPEASPRLFDFSSMVGIRRNEYLRLHKDCLVRDESGYLCVFVKKGKGGKKQWQRILPEFEEAVLAYFDGTDDFMFTKQEMKNKMDLHAIRAQVAKKAYEYYLAKLEANPDYRLQLEQELQARWEACGKVWDVRKVRGTYTVRKGNRDLASRYDRPLHYDRLALMAVSTFHLSHWRCGVAVANYLLALGD